MFKIGKVIEKAKAMVPKAIEVGRQAVKSVANKVANSALGKAVAAIPQTLKAVAEKGVGTAKKVAAAIPKAIDAVKKTAEEVKGKVQAKAAEVKGKVQAKAEAINTAVTNKVQEITTDINERNKRIGEKLLKEIEATASGLIRGTITAGAVFPLADGGLRSSSLMLNFLLQSRKAIVEEYPLLNLQGDLLKGLIDGIKSAGAKGEAIAGSYIYNLNVPIISDFVGGLTGQKDPEAESNYFTVKGAFYRGMLVDGLFGTVEGIANLVADPFTAIEGINNIVMNPRETLPAIGNGIKEFVDKKIIHGSAEDRAQVAGQAAFEVVSWLVGAGEAKAGIKAADAASDGAKLSKVADAASDVAKTTNVIDKALDGAKAVKLFNKAGLKSFGKNLAASLDSSILNAGKRAGDFIDNIRAGMSRLSGPQPELAGIGMVDDIGRSGDKIEDIYTTLKKSLMKKDEVPGSSVNIKPKVDGEDLKKLVDDIPEGSAVKGPGGVAAKGSGKVGINNVNSTKELLQGEGEVGTYKDLIKSGSRGDNLTPHHMPSAEYMKSNFDVSKNNGVAMNMEQPSPGVGGRHRMTRSYGSGSDLAESPRDALARDIIDARSIYQKDGLYTSEIRESLQKVIDMNKKLFPEIFKKPGGK